MNKGKAKRLAKEAARKGSSPVNVIMPTKEALERDRLLPILGTVYGRSPEEKHFQDAYWAALMRLRLHIGADEDIPMMYTRMTFGRRIANKHFHSSQLPDILHHATQTITFVGLEQQVEENLNLTYLTPEEADEIGQALQVVEDMVKQLTPDQFRTVAYEHSLTAEHINPQDNFLTIEEYFAKNPQG